MQPTRRVLLDAILTTVQRGLLQLISIEARKALLWRMLMQVGAVMHVIQLKFNVDVVQSDHECSACCCTL